VQDSHMECVISHGIMYEVLHEKSELCSYMSFRWYLSIPLLIYSCKFRF
jgi:hypothetical protein